MAKTKNAVGTQPDPTRKAAECSCEGDYYSKDCPAHGRLAQEAGHNVARRETQDQAKARLQVPLLDALSAQVQMGQHRATEEDAVASKSLLQQLRNRRNRRRARSSLLDKALSAVLDLMEAQAVPEAGWTDEDRAITTAVFDTLSRLETAHHGRD